MEKGNMDVARIHAQVRTRAATRPGTAAPRASPGPAVSERDPHPQHRDQLPEARQPHGRGRRAD